MSIDENKASARRLVEELWNQGNLTTSEQFFEPNMLADATDRHAQSIRDIFQAVRLYRAAFPDWQVRIDALVAEEDQVMMRWTAHATHTGTLQGIAVAEVIAGTAVGERSYRRLLLVAPTGWPVTVDGVCHFTFRNGKVASFWVLWDEVELMRQVGVLPAMGG